MQARAQARHDIACSSVFGPSRNSIAGHAEGVKQPQECRMAIPTFAIPSAACSQQDPDVIVAGEMHGAERLSQARLL